MKITTRTEIVSEIQKQLKDREHLFDTTIELSGELNQKFTIDSVTPEGVFIMEDGSIETDLVKFDDVLHKEDLELILETLTTELSK